MAHSFLRLSEERDQDEDMKRAPPSSFKELMERESTRQKEANVHSPEPYKAGSSSLKEEEDPDDCNHSMKIAKKEGKKMSYSSPLPLQKFMLGSVEKLAETMRHTGLNGGTN
jgi:hypothetical protein